MKSVSQLQIETSCGAAVVHCREGFQAYCRGCGALSVRKAFSSSKAYIDGRIDRQ